MELIEKQLIDKIEILENNIIQIRTANIIEKNGNEIAKSYHRKSLCPLDDILNEDLKVQSIANLLWTNEVIENYKLSIVNNL
jgi:hypothetical protein